MSKNLQKTLAGALATISAVSIATPVMATSVDVDALYKNAYDAMVKAQETEKQTDINTAMDLIRQLRAIGVEKNDSHLINEANTWSSLVDKVQHPKLVKIVDAIVKAQDTGRQADINAAFATIEPELPATWKNSYTSAIDIVQQKLQRELVYAVEEAEKESTVATEATARKLVDEVLTADSKAMVEWAKIFEAKLNALILIDQPVSPGFGPEGNVTPGLDAEVGTLSITEIGEFSKSSLTINFVALTSNLDDVTLTVIDNNGNTIAVKAQGLVKGQTTATFTFNDYLKETPMGVWTVNGTKVNLTERAFLKDINSVSNIFDLTAKLNKSEYKGLVTYKVYNLPYYYSAIKEELNKGNRFTSVKEVQNLIDVVDKAQAEKMTEKEYVKSVKEIAADKDATTEQFANVLQQGVDLGYIKDVNGDWIIDYKAKINEKPSNQITTAKNIQDCIDEVKNGKEGKVDIARQEAIDALRAEKPSKNEILAALQNSLLGLDNVKAENIDHYYIDRENIANQLEKHATNLGKVNKYIEILNNKADIVNATKLDNMLTALRAFAENKGIAEFNNLSSEKKQDAAEELLRVSYVNGKLTLTEKGVKDIEVKVIEATETVTRKLEDLNKALKALEGERTYSNVEDVTLPLRNALEKITGEEASVELADKFFEKSFETNSEGKEVVKTYTNYTEVRAALK